ncbi:hypothetical protein TNIN_140941 [Trichonephila inaurata madagascariensis]|uniref:Uncharacterized protein n=1 Tax=Trichonephila inaurata madagascariensis TaxID=2747483 RepID=A0A8X6Y6F8_9ARAC|nr:hypothetical protein TNIN_140941 [Trichonephila inaurata madagascariensis]
MEGLGLEMECVISRSENLFPTPRCPTFDSFSFLGKMPEQHSVVRLTQSNSLTSIHRACAVCFQKEQAQKGIRNDKYPCPPT